MNNNNNASLNTNRPGDSSRIVMLDSFRGFTLLLILLLHSICKFNFWIEDSETQIKFPFLDMYIWKFVFFTTSGKAYTLFSFLLGFGYYLQFSKRLKNGIDYGARYIWRLAILFVFGLINIMFYSGDILILYALTAPILVITRHWKTSNILILSFILIISPLEWYALIQYIVRPENGIFYDYLNSKVPVNLTEAGSFIEDIRYNLVANIIDNLRWGFNDGRIFQAPGLFLLGVIAGRKRILIRSDISFYNKVIVLNLIILLVLFYVKNHLTVNIKDPVLTNLLSNNLNHLNNLFFSALLLFLFIRVWHTSIGEQIFKHLAVYGKMSLSNYIFQSIFGFLVFSRFGLSMYTISGYTISFIIALLIFIVQMTLSRLYSKNHTYGPFEFIWRKLTWIKFPPGITHRNQNSA